jgi:hypothetical protein
MKIFSLKKLTDWMFFISEQILLRLIKLLPLYINYYEDIIDNEIKITKISKSNNVLHIGCGSIPATSILIRKKTGANVTGIDKYLRSIKDSILCINKIDIKNKIQFKHENALNYPIENYDLIIFSQGVEPRNNVIKIISKTMKKNTIVIFRTFSTPEGNLAPEDIFLKDLFKFENMIKHKKHGLLSSIILLKK